MSRFYTFPLTLAAVSTLFVSLDSAFAAADNERKARDQVLVDQATVTVQTLFSPAHAKNKSVRFLNKAKAVMICPSVSHLSVVFGGTGGKCVLLSRDRQNSWSDPAFYTLSSGSVGLQLGYQHSQLIFFIMSRSALQTLLDHQFKFDAKAGVSFTSLGDNLQTSSTSGMKSDIYALQLSHGLFVGASLGGTKLTSNSAANYAYYDQSVGPEDIVVTMRVNNPDADPLRRALMQADKAS